MSLHFLSLLSICELRISLQPYLSRQPTPPQPGVWGNTRDGERKDKNRLEEDNGEEMAGQDDAPDPAKALEFKEKGNRCFQTGDWKGAEALYTKA